MNIETQKQSFDTYEKHFRHYARVCVKLPVEYCVSGSKPRRMAYAFKLSSAGVTLGIREKLDIDQQISLAIFVTVGMNLEAINLQSKIVWVDDAAREGTFVSGAVFVDPSAVEQEKLTRIIEKLDATPPIQTAWPTSDQPWM